MLPVRPVQFLIVAGTGQYPDATIAKLRRIIALVRIAGE